MRLGPSYQGVSALGAVVMLSPLNPEIGIAVNVSMPMLAANARYSATIASKTDCSYQTRSILLTASTTCRMPSRWHR